VSGANDGLPPGLLEAFRAQAAQTEGIDLEVYRDYDKDPLEPVLGLGDTDLRVGFFGRDPGRDEVRWGEPFIGAGGQHVRRALYQRLHGAPLPDFEASRAIGRSAFWANTVPYKPLGNKAWSMRVKQRFQPLMSQVLLRGWQGSDLITLGREAFLWFGINRSRAERDALDAFWLREDRFTTGSIAVRVEADGAEAREIRLHPLPHPSPLNATWYARFPALLADRLAQLDLAPDRLRIAKR